MGVQTCVISSSVDVRVDGVPRSGIDPDRTTLKEPGVALYFALKGRPTSLAQDAYDTPGVNLRSLALCLDAMRAVERHGGRIVGGKVFEGFAALPPPAGYKPKRPWWEVLRYSANEEDREFLSAPEVEARIPPDGEEADPDAGGDAEEMAELSLARDEAIKALQDGGRRERRQDRPAGARVAPAAGGTVNRQPPEASTDVATPGDRGRDQAQDQKGQEEGETLMNQIDRRLQAAIAGDPRFQPREEIWFAWFPVRLGPFANGELRWLRHVKRFKPLGLYWEYYDLNRPVGS